MRGKVPSSCTGVRAAQLKRYVSGKRSVMTERGTKIVIYVFAVGSALFVPLSSYIKIGVLTPTMYAGVTLVMVYFAANPRLLNSC